MRSDNIFKIYRFLCKCLHPVCYLFYEEESGRTPSIYEGRYVKIPEIMLKVSVEACTRLPHRYLSTQPGIPSGHGE